MKLALSRQAWKHVTYEGESLTVWAAAEEDGGFGVHVPDKTTRANTVTEDERHALAALALHGQEFGFTWEDVDALREYVNSHAGVTTEAAVFESIADRIEALLPPKKVG